jgi:hypothetical protein
MKYLITFLLGLNFCFGQTLGKTVTEDYTAGI